MELKLDQKDTKPSLSLAKPGSAQLSCIPMQNNWIYEKYQGFRITENIKHFFFHYFFVQVLGTDELNAYLNKYHLELDPQLDALVGRYTYVHFHISTFF